LVVVHWASTHTESEIPHPGVSRVCASRVVYVNRRRKYALYARATLNFLDTFVSTIASRPQRTGEIIQQLP
jgi:hypothetical protein